VSSSTPIEYILYNTYYDIGIIYKREREREINSDTRVCEKEG